MSYYRPVFKEDNFNEITSADYIGQEYVYNRQSLNDLSHGFPVIVNAKTVDTPRSTPTSSSSHGGGTKRSRTIHNMKKLFNNKTKKASNPDLSGATALNSHATGHTLDRIVSLKAEEKRKWELEKEEFDRRQREHEIHLLEIEQKEVERREEEVRKRNDELIDKRRKNKMVQDKMQEQIKALEQKLIEFRTSHRKEEEDLEDNVRVMEDQLFEVKSDMEKRMRNLNLAFDTPHSMPKRDSMGSESGYSHATSSTVPVASAPSHYVDEPDGYGESPSEHTQKYGSMYPAIPVVTRSYETSKIMATDRETGTGLGGSNPTPQPRSSLGSSPKSSHSDRSDTPRGAIHQNANDNHSDKSGEFADFGSASS